LADLASTAVPVQYYPLLVEPPAYRPRRWLPILLLAATALSTMAIGARLEYNFGLGLPAYRTDTDIFPFLWIWRHPALLVLGVPFAAALLGILLAHELGHYLACRYYRLDATWPHFIPAPTLIGTLGAFIAIRSPFRNRREVFDVGVAGPLAGFVVAVPVLLLGLARSPVQLGHPAGALEFGWPPLLAWILHAAKPGAAPAALVLSPLARAAWVGLLATMLNLIPSGQLDGGHLLYAFFPRLHRWVSWVMAALMLYMGWRFWTGWYLWAALLASMRARHPYVPPGAPLGAVRVVLAVVALLILAATFIATPFILA